MGYVRTSDAATEPITLTELKEHLRVDHTDEDTLITSLITAARNIAEDYCERSFITQTWKMYMNDWPIVGSSRRPYLNEYNAGIRLPRGKVISVTTVKLSTTTSLDTTVASSEYYTSLETDVAEIRAVDGWDATETGIPNSIEIAYVCGYGDAISVPQSIKSAILMIASDLYEYRKSNSDRTVNRVGYLGKEAWMFLLDMYKLTVYV
jgi:uncharacterized phiE125 gp8 family phage protein